MPMVTKFALGRGVWLLKFSNSRMFTNCTAAVTAKKTCIGHTPLLAASLADSDPELAILISKERQRQVKGLELIASENFTSSAVLQCLGSCLTNKYSEGLPGDRYYGGNEYIDQIEILCQKRALEAFNLNPAEWGVNVQPYSGSPANFAVYTALVKPHGRIMGLDLPDGGHLTHGFMTTKKKISATSIFFESMPYKVNPETGFIDYEALENTAKLFKPKMIIAGISCYSRCLDYERFRKICDENEALLFSDMSHVAGLVSTGIIPSPFDFSDIVTTTTHKSLRGPRGAMIFFRKGSRKTKSGQVAFEFEDRINAAVFPGLQGGPHNNAIAGIATAMLQTKHPSFQDYQQQVVRNAKCLAQELGKRGFNIVTGGTDVHLLLVNLKNLKVSGAKGEYILECVGIACNKNTVPGDKSASNPSGIRLGTPALTTRGLGEEDMAKVAEFILKAIELAQGAQKLSGPKLVDFKNILCNSQEIRGKVEALKMQIEEYAEGFFMPG